MPRFFDPERYNEDWYIELRGEYQKFYDYIHEMCDNAGVWKPNKFDFEAKTGFKINMDSLFKKVNGCKERIIVLENKRWFLPGFIQFQFFNKVSVFDLIRTNPFHAHIIQLLDNNLIKPDMVRGLQGVYQTSKDKDKDTDKEKDIERKGGSGERSVQTTFSLEKPTIQQAMNYFAGMLKQEQWRKKDAMLEGQKFFAHYQGVGWKMNGQPIEDWKAIASKWIIREVQKGK